MYETDVRRAPIIPRRTARVKSFLRDWANYTKFRQVLTDGGKFGIICAEPGAGSIIYENFTQLQQKRLDNPARGPPEQLCVIL